MSVCVFARKKRQKNGFETGKNTTFFEHTPICLEVSVSSFADRHRVFDEKVTKTSKNN